MPDTAPTVAFSFLPFCFSLPLAVISPRKLASSCGRSAGIMRVTGDTIPRIAVSATVKSVSEQASRQLTIAVWNSNYR